RDTVYVGLYTASGGDVSISGGVTFDPSQLTLTCISTGGPATTVTWTRDSTTVTQGTQTVLNDPVTAQYTHTLTVTTGGEYTCTVANNKPSSASATITVTGTGPPTNVAARQTNPTSILVEWTPSSDATGYTIHYDSSEGPSGSVSIDGDSTNSYTLENLQNGETYTISIVATSANLPSQVVTAGMAVGLVPGNPELVRSSTSTDSITISVGFPAGSVVDSYVVMWTSVECSDNGMMTVDGSPATYTIMGLEEGISYNITVRASNNAGSGNSTSITVRTNEAAPNGAPNSVTEVSAAPNSITVGWEEVDCLLRNGMITGYTAQALRNGMVEATANVVVMLDKPLSLD
ncbi:Receptor-type tyrosine-protein phosphatase delta, partial [Geodia barretti]